MANEARWIVSLAESDEPAVKEWAARARGLGVQGGIAGALRRAVALMGELTDDQITGDEPIGADGE
jgi:hypothetical protein